MKLKVKNKNKVRENINNKYKLSPLANAKLLSATKFNIKAKVLNNLIQKYGESIISYRQICDFINALETVIEKHQDRIKNKGVKNATQQKQG